MPSKRQREEACWVCGHFHDYEGGEPCKVCGHRLVKMEERVLPTETSAFPTEILPGFLYLGSYDNASRSELLKAMGVTHILNVVPSVPNLYKNSFTYHSVSCVPADFQECGNFLDSAKQPDTKVLVHCMTGTSRSPAVVIAYLMRLRRWRLNESFKWVQERRPTINLVAEDIQRLQAEEIRVLGSSSTGFDPRQLAPSGAPQQQTQQLQQQHQHSAADANVQQSASNPAPLFTWNLNQPQQQQQQQPAMPLAIPAGGAYHAQAPPSSDFSFGAGSSNGTFVFGQSPTYLGHASAGNMTS